MKRALKYILPLLCIVALLDGNAAPASGEPLGEYIASTVVDNAHITMDDAECVVARLATSVGGMQPVHKSSRQGSAGQHRCGAFVKANGVYCARLAVGISINLKCYGLQGSGTAHYLISLGKLII